MHYQQHGDREIYMDTDSKEEISADEENDKLPPHQEASSHYEDSRDNDEEELDSGRPEATEM
jgi:hypothetical protein